MSDDTEKQPSALTDQIKKPDTPVKNKPGHDRPGIPGGQVIPILDELVSPEDYYEEKYESLDEDVPAQNIDDIAELVEQKLSSELDEIVNLLKGNLKDSIIHELQDQMNKDPGKKSDS